jgi:hypothetical protein
MERTKIFISSVQSEFAKERRMLADYLQKDLLLRRFFDVFIFEDIPARDRNPEQVYIEEVKRSDLYLGILGKQFGYEFADGTSPTQREFNAATENHKNRLIFLLNIPDNERNKKETDFIAQISQNLIYGKFSTEAELLSGVYSSLIDFLVENGDLRVEPFDKSANRDAEWSDISDEKIEWFVRRAKSERKFPLTVEDGKEKIFTHLNLLNKGKLTNAAILLFGLQPQRFFLTSEIKCAHFHGTTTTKPIPFYQVYKGNLFELVDQAVDFVLSKIDLAVGTRAKSVEVPTAYEIPVEVVQEAIVNAVAHRNYDSNGSVQVMLFKDRLEIRNPGRLPAELSIDQLTEDHSSFPRNPLIADALYYTKYIERMGTGIQDMVKRCLEYGLPEPKFEIQDGFVTKIFRKQGLAFEKVKQESGIKEQVTAQVAGQVAGQVTGQVTGQVEKMLLILDMQMLSVKEMMIKLSLAGRDNFLKAYLQPAIEQGFVAMKYPKSPNHPHQRYYLTEKGKEIKMNIGIKQV